MNAADRLLQYTRDAVAAGGRIVFGRAQPIDREDDDVIDPKIVEDSDVIDPKVVPLTAEQVKICKETGITEDQFRAAQRAFSPPVRAK